MEIVWIFSERCWGTVVTRGVDYCLISFFKEGFYHKEIFELDDIIEPIDMGIDYDFQKESDEA
jgi:hypothetical protein